MKIKCKVCRRETEINDLDYNPGDRIVIECSRCGNELEATIPLRDDVSEDAPRVRVVSHGSEIKNSAQNSSIASNEDLKSIWYAAGSSTASEHSKAEKSSQTQPVVASTTVAQQSASSSVNNRQNPSGTQIPKTIPEETHNGFTQPSVQKRNKSKDGRTSTRKIMIIILIVVVVVVGSFIWLHNGYSGNDRDACAKVEDSVYAAAVEVVEVSTDDYDSTAYYVEPDTVIAEVEAVEVPDSYREVERRFIPSIASSTASEAYDVYPAYVTDDRFGDAWATTDIIQNAIRNGLVEYFVKGEGDIEGYPLSIDAVRLKDGRLYGRYHNDYNGVKLDINGGFDIHEDLVIKLGHKSETSYWILKYEGMDEDGILHYKGTWGKNNKSTELKIRAYNNL